MWPHWDFSISALKGGRKQDARTRKREEKGWRKQFLDKSPTPRAGGGRWRDLTSLTAVKLLGGQGDDGTPVQLPRSLAGGGCLDTALLSIFLQQLSQPHQVAVAKQGIGVQPPARPRKRPFISQPLTAASFSRTQEGNSPPEWRVTWLFFPAFDYTQMKIWDLSFPQCLNRMLNQVRMISLKN